MSAGVVVLLVALATTVAIGGVRAVTSGRFRGTVPPEGAGSPDAAPATTWRRVAEALAGSSGGPGGPGESATLVQFSSAFCAPCRATRRVLGEVADILPGVVHVEIDAEHHLALVRELGVARTPTTLVLDGTGAERTRAVGAPTKQQVLAALA